MDVPYDVNTKNYGWTVVHTESGLGGHGLGLAAGRSRTGLVDGPDAELVLHALHQVRDSALAHVSGDLSRLLPLGAVGMGTYRPSDVQVGDDSD